MIPEKSVQIGMRGSLYDPDDFKIAADLGFTVIPGDKLHTYSPEDLLKVIKEKGGRQQGVPYVRYRLC